MQNKSKQNSNRKTFKEAAEATDDVKNCYESGIQALEKNHKKKVTISNSKKCGGSLNLDHCLSNQKKYLNENRWDYIIDYNKEVYFVEVHSAHTNEVSTVLRKLDWLKLWLRQSAPEILKLKANLPYFWIQSNGYHILKGSSQERLINQNGLKPIRKLLLE